MSSYSRINSYLAMGREVGGFRTIQTVKDAAATVAYAFSTGGDNSLPFPVTDMKIEDEHTAGSATRNADKTVYIGYPPVDFSLDLFVQAGRFLYGVLGTCDTVGTAYDPAKTDTIASGQGTATVTLTTGGLTIDAHIGDYMEFTNGDQVGLKFHIIDNAAGTITLDQKVGATVDNDAIKLMTAPFTHTITENNATLPSFYIHGEIENTTDAESHRWDLLGCIFNSFKFMLEKDGRAKQDVGIIGAKSVAGSDLARDTAFDSIGEMVFGDGVVTFTLMYDSTNQISNCESIEIEANNNAELEVYVDDSYANGIKVGPREYTIRPHAKPTTKVLKTLRNTKVEDYATDLVFTFKIQVSATHYIQLTFSKLKVIDYPLEIPDATANELGVDFTLSNAAGTLAGEVKDAFGIGYYEGSSL